MSILSSFDIKNDHIWFPIPLKSVSKRMKGYYTSSDDSCPAVFLKRKDGFSRAGFLIPMTAVKLMDLKHPKINELPPVFVAATLTLVLRNLIPNHVDSDVLANFFMKDVTNKEKQVPCFLNPLLALHKKEGSCWEKASVLLAVCRLNGIQSRIVGSLRLPHFWVEMRFGKGEWLPVDSYCGYLPSKLFGMEAEKTVCVETDFESLELEKV